MGGGRDRGRGGQTVGGVGWGLLISHDSFFSSAHSNLTRECLCRRANHITSSDLPSKRKPPPPPSWKWQAVKSALVGIHLKNNSTKSKKKKKKKTLEEIFFFFLSKIAAVFDIFLRARLRRERGISVEGAAAARSGW